VAGGRSPEAGREQLDAATRADEALGLALRTRHGATVPTAAAGEAAALERAGLLARRGERVGLTRRGRLLGTEVTVRLLAAASPVASTSAAVGTR